MGWIDLSRDSRYLGRYRRELDADRAAAADATFWGYGQYLYRFPNGTTVTKAYGILAPYGDITAPSVPTGLVEDYHGATTAGLSWTASTDNVAVAGYQVYRNGTPIGTSATTSYADSGLTPGTQYSYSVAAYDAAGNNSGTGGQTPLVITTLANHAPAWTVGQQELTTNVGYSLLLTTVCSDQDANPLTFTQVSGTLPTGLTFNSSSKSISGTPTVVGSSSVTYRASDGITTTDQVIVFNVLNADTTAPSTSTLTATAAGSTQVDLSWTAATDPTVANARTSGVSGYKIYRDGSLRTTLGNVLTWSDTGLAASTTYSYTVACFDVSGNLGSQSAAQQATTASGFDFYISVNGTGPAASPGGSFANPWPLSMLNDATARLRYKGRRIGLMDGEYGLITIMGQPSAGGYDINRLRVQGGPDSATPTVLQAVNRHLAIISGQRDSLTPGVDWQSGLIGPLGSNVTFDGIKFKQANYRTITNYVGGGNFFIVKNCWFTDQYYMTGANQGANSASLFMQGSADSACINCKFETGGSPSDNNRHSFLQVYDSTRMLCDHITVIGSATPYRSGTGIFYKEAHNRDGEIRNCFVDQRATSGGAIMYRSQLTTASVDRIHNNVLLSINCCHSDAYPNVGTIHFYNNTCDSTGCTIGASVGALTLDRFDVGPAIQINYHDNIVHAAAGLAQRGHVCVPASTGGGEWGHNFYGDGSPAAKLWTASYDGPGYSGLQNWPPAFGASTSLDAANPGFAGTGTGSNPWRLADGSVCKTLGAGSTEIGAFAQGGTVGCDF